MTAMKKTPDVASGAKKNQEAVITSNSSCIDDSAQADLSDIAEAAEAAALATIEAQLDDIDDADDLAAIEAAEAAEAVSPAEALGIAPLDTREPLPIACGRAVAHFVQTTCESGNRADLLDLGYLTRELMGICEAVRELYAAAIDAENAESDSKRKKGQVVKSLGTLPERAIISAYAALYKPVRLDTASNSDQGPLLHYVDDEADSRCGIYVPTMESFTQFVYMLSAVPPSAARVEAMAQALRAECPLVKQATERWIVMQNGVFDYANQKLYQFSPERVFLSKVGVAYKPCANPVITREDGSTWDIETCLWQLACGDEDVYRLYWEIIGAALRATERWNKCVILYGPRGNNGKSTLLDLIRNLVGAENTAIADLTTLSSRFGRDQLLPAGGSSPRVVMAHENADPYIAEADSIKAMITQNVVKVEVKGKNIVALDWRGLIIQGLNEMPRTREQNGSINRRFLPAPFMAQIIRPERWTNSMANDAMKILEDPYIIEDFILRREVLEYVAYRALTHAMTPAYYALSEPTASLALATEQQLANNPALLFWDEHKDEFSWPLLPSQMLYDMYKTWLLRTNPSAHPVSHTLFSRQIKTAVEDDPDWRWTPSSMSGSVNQHRPEPLLKTYGLSEWYEWPNYEPSAKCRAGRWRGVIRM